MTDWAKELGIKGSNVGGSDKHGYDRTRGDSDKSKPADKYKKGSPQDVEKFYAMKAHRQPFMQAFQTAQKKKADTFIYTDYNFPTEGTATIVAKLGG